MDLIVGARGNLVTNEFGYTLLPVTAIGIGHFFGGLLSFPLFVALALFLLAHAACKHLGGGTCKV